MWEALKVKAGKTNIGGNPKGQSQVHTGTTQGYKAKGRRHVAGPRQLSRSPVFSRKSQFTNRNHRSSRNHTKYAKCGLFVFFSHRSSRVGRSRLV